MRQGSNDSRCKYNTDHLSKLNRKISILHELFGEIIINQAVYDEIKAKRSYGYDEVDPHFIRTQSIRSLQRFIDESA